MDRQTGRTITGLEHLRQSITDIITTPIGSRVMRRDYGSRVPELIDHPDNSATRTRLHAAIATALMRWEPRVKLMRIGIARVANAPGRAEITLDGIYTPLGAVASALQISVTVQGRMGAATAGASA